MEEDEAAGCVRGGVGVKRCVCVANANVSTQLILTVNVANMNNKQKIHKNKCTKK